MLFMSVVPPCRQGDILPLTLPTASAFETLRSAMRAKNLLWIGSALGALAALPAAAADHDVAVTIYTNDTALIQDHRSINVTGGRQRIEFQNVSAQIRPETVALAAEGISIIEQNFDFDLLTPAK